MIINRSFLSYYRFFPFFSLLSFSRVILHSTWYKCYKWHSSYEFADPFLKEICCHILIMQVNWVYIFILSWLLRSDTLQSFFVKPLTRRHIRIHIRQTFIHIFIDVHNVITSRHCRTFVYYRISLSNFLNNILIFLHIIFIKITLLFSSPRTMDKCATLVFRTSYHFYQTVKIHSLSQWHCFPSVVL